MKKVCIRGSKEHPEKVIGFLEIMGGKDKAKWKGNNDTDYYVIDIDGSIYMLDFTPEGYTEISFADACAILDGRAVLNDDCTVTYKEELSKFTVKVNDTFCEWEYVFAVDGKCIRDFIKAIEKEFGIKHNYRKLISNEDLPKFPREMWVWDYYKENARLREIHAYVPTLKFCFIAKENDKFVSGWENASITDPRIEEAITIEEAEKLIGKKIRR